MTSRYLHPLQARHEAARSAARQLVVQQIEAFDALVTLAEGNPVGTDPFDANTPVPVIDFCPVLSMRGGTRRFKNEAEWKAYQAQPAITQTLQLYVRKSRNPAIYDQLPAATRSFLETAIGLEGDIHVDFCYQTKEVDIASLGAGRGASRLSAEDVARFGLTERVEGIMDRMRSCDTAHKNVNWGEMFRQGAKMDQEARAREQARPRGFFSFL